MTRFIEVTALISLAILFVGCIIMPGVSMFWLAASTSSFALLRLALISLLALLAVLGTPPIASLRKFLGLIALVLGLWSLNSTYNGTMQLLDGLSLMAASFALGVKALEPDYDNQASINWRGLVSILRPYFPPLQRRALIYAFLALMMLGLISRDYQFNLRFRQAIV